MHNRTPGGPAALLDAAAARLGEALQARGVTLSLDDRFDALEDTNRRHQNAWYTLLPRPAAAPVLALLARDSEGEVVATQGAVLLDCTRQSFGERLGDLSVFHTPGRAPAEEWCFCASDAAFATRGRTAFVVAGWVRPDWRGAGLFHPMAFAMRVASWTAWDAQGWAGLVAPDIVRVWDRPEAGRRLLERRPTILYNQAGVGRRTAHLLRFTRAGVALDMADAARGLAGLGAGEAA